MPKPHALPHYGNSTLYPCVLRDLCGEYVLFAFNLRQPIRLTTDWLLSCFSKRKSIAQKNYQKFVAEGKKQTSPWKQLQHQIFLGSQGFVDNLQKNIEAGKDLSEIPKSQTKRTPQPISYYDNKSNSRNEAIISAYASGGYSMKELGTYFCLHYSRISRIINE